MPTEAREIAPVAEVVERLRSIGGPTREEAADLIERQQAEIEAWRDTAKLFESQSAEIERLSRERDTVIEECVARLLAALERNVALRVAMKRSVKIITTNLYHQREKVEDAASILRDALAAPQPPTVSTQGWQDGALKDIGIERLRQMSVEGWTPEHDDTHDQFEMARAAAFYCVTTYAETLPEPTPDEPSNRYSAFHTADCAWPSTWDGCWRKPKDARRNLVRAAALIVAEIERLDRANGAPPAHVQPDLSTLTRERDQAREALRTAREFAVKAFAELVELDDFDPSEHHLVKQIDTALSAAPASETSDGERS